MCAANQRIIVHTAVDRSACPELLVKSRHKIQA